MFGHGQEDAGTTAVGSCLQFIYVKFEKKKNLKPSLFIFSVQCHLLCRKKSPWCLTFLLLLCDDQKGDVFTPRHFQGTRGVCSQFTQSNPGWTGLLHLSCKIRMMFVVAFAAKEAWRQNFEETAEWGMFLGALLPRREGRVKQSKSLISQFSTGHIRGTNRLCETLLLWLILV